jgi:chromate transporter
VAVAFSKLGMTSFGGPIAHLGYFRREFVERRRWLDEEHFGQLLALCQFLPGPASSQLAFSLGLLRAGWLGGLAAFICFTLPSALLLFALASSAQYLDGPLGQSVIHGLKLVAVAVVAQGIVAMARTLTPDLPRALMAAVAAGLVVISGSAWIQLLIVAGGATLGPWVCRRVLARRGETFPLHYGRRTGSVFLVLFGMLLIASFTLAPHSSPLGQVAGAFYRTGALVFGGGHVVLPLLQQAIVDPGWVGQDTFLAGYGAAQAVPGPMFALAAFLGERLNQGQGGAPGATLSLLAIFLPGTLLVAGALPFWRAIGNRDQAARMLAGVNAAVVGLLVAAFYNPVWISAIRSPGDIAIALAGFVMLAWARWSPLIVVAWCVLASLARTRM